MTVPLDSSIYFFKFLLRHQFPAVPKVVSSPSIPQWQLSVSEAKDAEIEPRSEDESTEKSLSPSPEKKTCEIDMSGDPEEEGILDRIESLMDYTPKVFQVNGNGLDGIIHTDGLPQSTSVVESEEKSIPVESDN